MSISVDERQAQKLEQAKKEMSKRIVYEIAKHHYAFYAGLSTFEFADFICKKIGICFVSDQEFKLIEMFYQFAQGNKS
jgi:hypothetical protein